MSIWLGDKKLAGDIVKYSHNIGDIFYTSRTDTILAGAVECNGATYQTTDYTGNESIGALLASGKVPYISLSQYASDLAAHGSVRAFGWDGGSSTAFRVPTLSNVFLEAGQAASAGEYISAGLPNITGVFGLGNLSGVSYPYPVTTASGAFVATGTSNVANVGVSNVANKNSLVDFNASRSSGIYGSSTTVQPNSVKYRAMVQLFNGATDEAVATCAGVLADVADLKDLSNITAAGKNIANWSTNVSNCITEIPQDIKLELNAGTLTLKAGSKVYIPNGVGVFNEIITTKDFNHARVSGNSKWLVIYTGTGITTYNISNSVFSGSTAPSGEQYMVWYDTTNNLIKYTSDGGSSWQSGYSLPLGIVSTNETQISSIDQIFNGFGYIGSTVFALPGVEGLIPDGRNADGSLKNVQFVNDSIKIRTIPNGNFQLLFDGTTINYAYSKDNIYNEKENIIDYAGNGVIIVNCAVENDKITSFTSKTAFHAVDYSDSEYIANCGMPSDKYVDLTLGAAGTQYTAPADGYVFLEGNTTNTNGYILLGGSSCDATSSSHAYNSGYYISATIPVRKGMSFGVWYLNLTAGRFRFVYANGAQ